ncbi:MAG: hypothetical protein QM771_16255 [Nitrospira sp.]
MPPQPQFPNEQTEAGEFQRQDDAFRQWVTDDGRSGFPAAAGRYHLYVSLACPWAHRTIIVRTLKQLESVVGMTVVDPIRDEQGWAFRAGQGHSIDPINGFHFLSEAYQATDPGYRSRVTVPVLWDTVTKQIVSNSDDDLMRMFNAEFNRFTASTLDLCPAAPRADIDEMNRFLYERVTASTRRDSQPPDQRGYERAAQSLLLRWINWTPDSANTAISAARNPRIRLATLRHPHPVRRRLSRTLQVQCPAHHRLSQSVRLPQRPLSGTRHRGNSECGPH